jgi:glutathione S-transferase
MPNGPSPGAALTIVGRSSSHFTRVTRIFAAELGVETAFRVVPDLSSIDARDYAGNPALSVPTLETPEGAWFGSLNVSRELARRSQLALEVVWPEALDRPLSANAQELTLHAMSAEVALIMGSLGAPAASGAASSGAASSTAASSTAASSTAASSAVTPGALQREKLQNRLRACLAWLDENLGAVLELLPPRDLSYLEVSLFCLVTHLDFRGVLATAPFANLLRFSERFAQRPSAQATPYRFDSPPPAAR